ncbi:RT0821/Lpp0805 family surface protein [Nitratireductor sp. GCM10026969]|uniref:RT0821/Lpp0805 family surface protein n=1 Tax=Nitratireductor sp. GCM10026969 TaxID=3252645 RepID=UPI00360D79B2
MSLRLFSRAALLVALAAGVQGCGATWQGAAALEPDRSLVTGSVPQTSSLPQEANADGSAILAALSADAPAAAVGRPWESPESEASGVITTVERQEEGGQSCLAFTTTRESFDGINLYRGLACERAAGGLSLLDLTRM